MRKIAILTDSACDIPPELEKQYDIDILPFVITLDGVSYVERRDFGFDEFYQMLRAAQGVPSTAQVTAIQFCEQYCKYVDEGYTDVVHVTINSTGSGTYDAAVLAQNMLREERPDHKLNIHLIDSHTYSYVYGAPVVQAAAFAGELLGLRPIISLIDGVTKVEDKVRGDAAVPAAMIKQVRKRMDYPDGDVHYMLGCTDIPNVKELEKLCRKEFGRGPDAVFKLGAAVASNTGPDAMAIVYQGVPRR